MADYTKDFLNAQKRQIDQDEYTLKNVTPGTPLWMQQLFGGSAGHLSLMQKLAAQQGGLQMNIPEYNVQKGDKYTKMFQASGRREGDVAAQGVSNAMAGRGGGGIGSSLAMQSQARANASTAGLAQGVGYDFQQYQADLSDYMTRVGIEQTRYNTQMSSLEAMRSGIQNALGMRFNILNQIVGAHLGQVASAAQIESARIGAEATGEAALWGAVGQIGAAAVKR